MTCFSFILQLASYNGTISEKDILEISKLTPLDRLIKLKVDDPGVDYKVQKVLDLYHWFLSRTQIPSEEMLKWISDKNLRNEAFNKSREFGQDLFDVLQSVDKQNLLEKLLI